MCASNSWSLENELTKLVGCVSIREALYRLRLIKRPNDFFKIIESPEGWIRGGSETYIYHFSLLHDTEKTDFVIKACVAFSPGANIEQLLNSWIDRRRFLEKAGASVPKLYAFGSGILIEEAIPYTLEERLLLANTLFSAFLLQLSNLARILANLGFHPIQPFSDLRSRGTDVVIVDFGQDLGPPDSLRSQNNLIFEQLIEQLIKWNLTVPKELEAEMRSLFFRSPGIGLH